VIDKLVASAIRFSSPDGKIEIRVSVRGAWAVLSVRHNGMSMLAEELEAALGPFPKSPESGAPEPVCGLATATRIVESHGGRGTTVTMTIPETAR
jgi:signal transduction histidine kinase